MRIKLMLLLLLLPLAACRIADDDEPRREAGGAAREGGATGDVTTPSTGFARFDPAELERQRLDPSWRSFAERDRLERAGTAPAPPAAGVPQPPTPAAPNGQPPAAADTAVEPTPPPGPEGSANAPAAPPAGAPESFEGITPEAANAQPRLPVVQEGGGPSTLAVQVLLDRARFSPGVIDGRWGKNTEKAVYWLQAANGLEPTGVVDQETSARLTELAGMEKPVVEVTVAQEDLAGPFVAMPDDVYEQADLECLCYGSPAELLSERYHTTAELLTRLNPQVDLASLAPGTRLWVPAVQELPPPGAVASPGPAQGTASPVSRGTGPQEASPVARIVVSRGGFYTQALDAAGNVLYHFPSTLGSEYDPSPEGGYRVTNIAFDPEFRYQPKLFHEVPDDQPEAVLPAGPNSPVGRVWMALSKQHFGIHGTAVPETIGYTTSHGCVRLTNWDALFLAGQTKPGTPVVFRE